MERKDRQSISSQITATASNRISREELGRIDLGGEAVLRSSSFLGDHSSSIMKKRSKGLDTYEPIGVVELTASGSTSVRRFSSSVRLSTDGEVNHYAPPQRLTSAKSQQPPEGKPEEKRPKVDCLISTKFMKYAENVKYWLVVCVSVSLAIAILSFFAFSECSLAIGILVLVYTAGLGVAGFVGTSGRPRFFCCLLSTILAGLADLTLLGGGAVYNTVVVTRGISAVAKNYERWSKDKFLKSPDWLDTFDGLTVVDGLEKLAAAYPEGVAELRRSRLWERLPRFGHRRRLSLKGTLGLFNAFRQEGVACGFGLNDIGRFRKWTLSCSSVCGYGASGGDYWQSTKAAQDDLSEEELFLCNYYALFTGSSLLLDTYYIGWICVMVLLAVLSYVAGCVLFPILFYHSVQLLRLSVCTAKQASKAPRPSAH